MPQPYANRNAADLTTRQSSPAGPQVQLITAGLTAYIQPAIAPIIEKLRAARRILPTTEQQVAGELFQPVPWFTEVAGDETTAPGGRWAVTNLRPHFSLPPGTWFAFPAGLAFDVKINLQQLDYDVQTHWRPGPTHGNVAPDEEYLDFITGDEYQFLHRVRLFPRGLILTRRLGQNVEHVAFLTRLFPHAKIAIAFDTRNGARRFRGRLASVLNEPVGIVTAVNHGVERCNVVTFNVLGSMAFAFSSVDVVVIPDAEKALRNIVLRALSGFNTQRVYGFLPAVPRLHSDDDLTLRAFVGPIIYRVPECPRRAVVQVFGCAAPRFDMGDVRTPLERKQAMIWRNAARNQLIADLAYACTDGDVNRCQDLGVRPAENLFWIPARPDQPPRIVILVESTVHAEALHELIPDAEIVRRSATAVGTVTINPKTAASGIRIQIVTSVAAQTAEWPAEVVIRGSGQSCTLISANLPRIYCAADEHDRQLLFDISDGLAANDRAVADRRDAYYQNGWDVKF